MKLTEHKKQLLKEFCNFFCEECGKSEKQDDQLEIHRIRRGNNGGEYNLRNIKVVHKSCHKKYHGREFK